MHHWKNLSFLSSFGLRVVFVKGSKIAVFVEIVTSKRARWPPLFITFLPLYQVSSTIYVRFFYLGINLKNDKSTSRKSIGNLSWVFDAHQPQQQFLEKSQKLQISQFLLGNLPPPLPLKLINFRKKAISPIFRNLWRNRSFCWAPFYLLQPLN